MRMMCHKQHGGDNQDYADAQRDPQGFAEIGELDREPDCAGNRNDRNQDRKHEDHYRTESGGMS